MSEYKVIEVFNKLGLESRINEMLNDGWQLVGGLMYYPNNTYIQAMVKYNHTYLHFNADGDKFKIGDKTYDISLKDKKNKS